MKLSIGHKLLSLREERKLTQTDMAQLLQIPDATYARYERNQTQVPYDKIVRFADSLKIPIQELLPDTMSIQGNNNHHSGQGGGAIVFGNLYFYVGSDVANQENKQLKDENKELKDKLENLEQKIEALLAKLAL